MRKVEHTVAVVLEEHHQSEVNQCLGQELSEDGHQYITIGLRQPLLTTVEFQFHAQRVS